jgi:hypothetical protein
MSGVRVIDIGNFLAGPYATSNLRLDFVIIRSRAGRPLPPFLS